MDTGMNPGPTLFSLAQTKLQALHRVREKLRKAPKVLESRSCQFLNGHAMTGGTYPQQKRIWTKAVV